MKCKSNLSIDPSSIHLSTHPSIFVIHLSTHHSICPSTHLLIYPSMSIHLSNIYTSFRPSIFQSIHISIHPSIIIPSFHTIFLTIYTSFHSFLPFTHLLIIFFQNKKLNMGNTFWEIFIKFNKISYPSIHQHPPLLFSTSIQIVLEFYIELELPRCSHSNIKWCTTLVYKGVQWTYSSEPCAPDTITSPHILQGIHFAIYCNAITFPLKYLNSPSTGWHHSVKATRNQIAP